MEPVTFTVQGQALYGEYHAPAKPRNAVGAVLLVHGFNSSIQEYGTLPERLAACGFHVLAYDQRGFGASGGERGRVGLDRFLADADAARDLLRDRAGRGTALGLVGHSLGASLATGYLARRGGFEAAVLAHPVDRLWDELWAVEKPVFQLAGRWNRRRMRRGRPSLRLPYRISYRNTFEDQTLAQAAKEADTYLTRTVNAANYDFARTMCASDWARRVTVPVLGVWSQRDRVVHPDHSLNVLESLGGPVERMEHRGGHSCFRDLDEEAVFEATAGFLTTRLGNGA